MTFYFSLYDKSFNNYRTTQRAQKKTKETYKYSIT